MKRGFTLIEVLIVVVLLGLIGLIAVPIVEKFIVTDEEKLYNVNIKMIEDGARNWASANIFSLPDTVGGTLTLTICDLEKDNRIEIDAKNPKTGQLFYKDSVVVITRTANGFDYKYDPTSGSSSATCN